MHDHATPEYAFEQLKKNTLEAIQSYFPGGTYEGRRQKVVLDNLRVDDPLSVDDIASQNDARDREGTWGVPVRGDLKLVDKVTGQVVDTKKGATLARLPKLTNRYSYIVNGNEYQVDHLFRLKSGVYARVQNNGELESEFNLLKSPTGRNFSLHLDPVKRRMSLLYGDARIPLYPIMKSLGVADDDIEKSWGKEIFLANKPATEEKFKKSLASFVKRTTEGPVDEENLNHLHTRVHEFFNGTALRPETTRVTLGEPHSTVSGRTLLQAAHKLLGVSRGTHQPDDRDSLAFKEVAGVEDFIPEKIVRGGARTIRAKMRQTVDRKKLLGEIVPTDLFNRPIHEFFVKGGSVAERSDQTNPIQMLSAHRKTTLMSRDFGGIKNENSLTLEMRGVNQSHFGFLDPMHTPESERTGITLHLAANVRKNGKELEIPVFDIKEGKPVWVTADVFHQATSVLPDQVTWVNGKPHPIADTVKVKESGGEISEKPYSSARYILPSAKGMFNFTSNLIPFLPSNNGNRVMMADKQLEQAIGLKHREVPLVQSKTDAHDPEHTFDKFLGQFIATKAPETGKVVAVKPGEIHIQGADGKKHVVQTYENFPLNDAKGMLHSTPSVKVGDHVKKGQVVADNNFTKDGVLAMGTNLRVGYIPYKGYNFEDGIVISETAAKKLTSEHLYKKAVELDPDKDHVSKEKFKAWAVTRSKQMSVEHLDALDENGIIKPGTRVSPGQVLVAAIGKNDVRKASFLSGYSKKRVFQPFVDRSLTWDEDHEGVVTKVVKDPGGKGFKVYVRTDEPAVIGDKLTGRHGNKGIITQIIPDHEMPFTMNSKGDRDPLHILLNPTGVPTRINVGQILETAAGKVAQKLGKPFIVNNFAGPNHDYRAEVEKSLKDHGVKDEEVVFDPKDVRKPLGSVLVGPQYILKLKHQVEKKLTARGGGTDIEGRKLPNDIDHQPVKGGEKGGQGFGALEIYSLLGHNARHNLREMATYKSDAQDMTFWSMIQHGYEPPPPKTPFSYEKFVGLLKGLGVNVTKEGTAIRIHPTTDKEILSLTGGRELKDATKTLRSKDLKPVPGGLFDEHLTGGIAGDKWAHIKLPEPIPNPLFVGAGNKPGPVPVLLGMRMKEFEDVMACKTKIDGLTGGKAIEAQLKKIDVEREVKQLKEDLPKLQAAELDRANKKLKYLLALRDLGMKPHEAYILHHVPVLPPQFRPATATPDGDVNYSPLNGHYKNIAAITEKLKEFDSKTFSEEHAHPLRTQLWDAVKGLHAIGSARPVYDVDSSGNRALKGILDIIGGGEGEQPKEGYFQSKLIKRRQNLSMRSTIVPEPALGIDEVGLPKGAAMEMYKPFVVAQLGKWGYEPLRAQEELKKKSAIAEKALEHVVADRPILLKRDPVLHKFGVMAFRPKLVPGKAIQIHPLVTGGYNADFDGDTMAGTVPISREAVEEAKKLLPSNNLFSPTSFGVMYLPNQDALLGIHLLSKWGKTVKKSFKDALELEKAVEAGSVHPTDVVTVKGFKEPTTFGRILIESRLPRGFEHAKSILHDPGFEVSKKTLKQIAIPLAKKHTEGYATAVNKLKDLGNEWAFKLGFSFGLKDLAPLPGRDAILRAAEAKVRHLEKTVKDKAALEKQSIDVWQDATSKMEELQKELPKHGNRLATMIYSGARGDVSQLRQMVAAPMLVEDSSGRTVPHPIKRSFSEGLDVSEFWMSQHGARKGIIQRSRGTAEPGAITKDIINASMSTLVVSPDCGTKNGVLMKLKDDDIHDRFLALGYKLKDGTSIAPGALITPEVLSRLKNSGHEKVLVRSPLKCAHGQGMCAKCYGLAEHGKLHDVGTNIGILAAQAMGEPSAQLSMNAFHTGGVAKGAGAKSIDAITRLRNLLEMPKKLRDEATIATLDGKIDSVTKDSAGGLDVFIEGQRHYVPRHLVKEDIKAGMQVSKGTALSHGFVNPHKLLEVTKDAHAVQNYLTNELHEGLFGGLGVRRRNVEVAVRNMTNLARVKDPGDSGHLHGDIVPRSVLEEYNRTHPTSDTKAVSYEPILKGTGEIPFLITNDWMQRLNYQRLHDTVQAAAAQGMKSELHGLNPIPGLAHGAEFGKPGPHRPKHVY